jgi:acetoacetyl-[acyl-carrier protein] synthase
MKLPVIVAIGGINSAGRSSGYHAYKRMIYQSLPEAKMLNTWSDLAHRMKLSPNDRDAILNGTLIRRIDIFDPNKVLIQESFNLASEHNFSAGSFANYAGELNFSAGDTILRKKYKALDVQSAGCLPKGFDPAQLYHSKNHPRGLSMTIYGVSDALTSLGLEWTELYSRVNPDEVSVYAGSALGQVDENSLAGLIGNPLIGKRVSSKMMPLSLSEMPADFMNSYMINSVGTTGHNIGACATFLYNLRLAFEDIQAGRARIAIVGSAEAPVNPDIIEGFNAMGALATDDSLSKLDQIQLPNYRRGCRPFSTNTGFVIAESAQFAILVDDALAIELGLPIAASVAGVFVNADGNKKSIAGPGVGNYITMGKSMHLARQILGEKQLDKTFVQAHGTGTPQNRVTESHILNEIAKTYGLSNWKVSAVKAYLGHSIGVAAGDQLMATLGAWKLGVLAGIPTIDHIAEDVFHDHLEILMEHQTFAEDEFKACLINSKGFGGNNASALILSPKQTMQMLEQKYGCQSLLAYHQLAESRISEQERVDQEKSQGQENMVYHFGTEVMDIDDVQLSKTSLALKYFQSPINYAQENPYQDYLK